MRVYFLDRNIISIIKDSNLNRKQKDRNKLDILKKLREIDRDGCFITPILSIMEGEHGKLEDKSKQIEDVIDIEFSELEKFFHNAELDKAFNLLFMKELLVIGKLGRDYKNNIKNKEGFLSDIRELILNLPKKEKLKERINQILDIASSYKLSRDNPMVIACILSICGEGQCKKIIKPNKEKYYNAAMDFTHLSIFSFLKSQYTHTYRRGRKEIVHCKLITGDIALNNFIKYFDFDSINGDFLPQDFGYYATINLSEYGKKKIPDFVKTIIWGL